jgi:hypothetical protein
MLVLYDVSSRSGEGRCCPLAARGYSRDGKKGKARIVQGLPSKYRESYSSIDSRKKG